ncbi:uncharacterized protein SPPG_07728 [Spizellomyces punctatus DAOM BR117]|uniref:Cryptic loci regulator 2 N-terminal domain-containing protein n=1 Tax=Spizellomyces punctatus (strain DAOM BR117) TaxID=645134 RepID=A0A0L0H6N9_SPIPD|nr:uncharacterized protein SPPG_07728 [Spizellomyces punctatus DAOM BR117]KNC96902.1 hypothetical protein SPPG_07728 [Spizellomyces punctatus DAOM BR117]|eukprot:XP_016604942.1 hypothetical protein SPPG_07728 [Spizellomyces punctatus DAOM BR117]
MASTKHRRRPPPAYSDGEEKWHPVQGVSQALVASVWLRQLQLTGWPVGYELLTIKVDDAKYHVLCGHPSGARFTSPSEFKPHLEWLYEQKSDCLCLLCGTPQYKPKNIARNRSSLPGQRWPLHRGAKSTRNLAGLPWHLRPGASAPSASYSQWSTSIDERTKRPSVKQETVETNPRPSPVPTSRKRSSSTVRDPPTCRSQHEMVSKSVQSANSFKVVREGSLEVIVLDDSSEETQSDSSVPSPKRRKKKTLSSKADVYGERDGILTMDERVATTIVTRSKHKEALYNPIPHTPTTPTPIATPRSATPPIIVAAWDDSPPPPLPRRSARNSTIRTPSRPLFDGSKDVKEYLKELADNHAPIFPLPKNAMDALIPGWLRKRS